MQKHKNLNSWNILHIAPCTSERVKTASANQNTYRMQYKVPTKTTITPNGGFQQPTAIVSECWWFTNAISWKKILPWNNEENMQAFNLSFYSQSNYKAQCSESKTGSGMWNKTTKKRKHLPEECIRYKQVDTFKFQLHLWRKLQGNICIWCMLTKTAKVFAANQHICRQKVLPYWQLKQLQWTTW